MWGDCLTPWKGVKYFDGWKLKNTQYSFYKKKMGGSGVFASHKVAYQNVLFVCMIMFSGLPKRLSYQWHSVLGVYWIPWPIWLAVPRIYGFIISYIPLVLYWLFLKERQKKVILNYCFLINDLKYILLNFQLSFQKGLLNSNY